MLGIQDYASKWSSFIRPSLNYARSKKLYQHLSLSSEKSEYIFCNNMIGSPNGYHQKLSHKIPYKATQTPTIWNRYIRGFLPSIGFSYYPMLLKSTLLIHP